MNSVGKAVPSAESKLLVSVHPETLLSHVILRRETTKNLVLTEFG